MAIVTLPRDMLSGIRWQQQGGLARIQRSAFTGRATQLDFGPAARWQAQGDVVPLWDDTQRADWAAFEAACQLPGTKFRLPVVERSQYGAAGNLLANPGDHPAASPWVLPGTNILWLDLFGSSAVANPPSTYGFLLSAGAGAEVVAWANNQQSFPIAAGQRLFLSAWVLDSGATPTGASSISVSWRNGSDAQLSTGAVLTSPGGGPTWRRVTGFVTAPTNTTQARVYVANNLTGNLQWIGGPRASLLPERATVNGSSNAGRSLALSGLALSQRNLRAGQFITVTLPGGDEQLIRLAADLSGDASGNGTASLTTPLRRTPAAGAVVELDQPWGLMRLTNEPGWSVDSQNIYGHTLEAEEAF